MQNSASQYQFTSNPRRATTQKLLLLGLVNRGQGRGPTRQSYLKPFPMTTRLMIRDLAQDCYNFSSPLCINRENSRFVIYLGISVSPPVISFYWHIFHSYLSFFSHSCWKGHQHTCLLSKITHLFPGDSEFGEEDNSWCESEGEACEGSTASTASAGDGENGRISPVSERLDSFLRNL